MSFLDDCRRLVGVDSTPGHGNSAAAELVGGYCAEAGLHVEYQRESVDGVDQCNVIARPQASRPAREILLQTHLDTAHAGHFSQWNKTLSNPFNASIYEDWLYGLGSADAKLDFLCKLEAAKAFTGRPLKTPFVLVGTFGAQSGMSGAIRLMRKKKVSATHAFIGEPTQMTLVNVGMGLAMVEISVPFSEEERAYRRNHDLQESSSSQSRMFAGRAAHSSDPAFGENAIMKMLEYLAHLPDGIAVMELHGGIEDSAVPSNAILEIDMVGGFKEPILPKISHLHARLLQLETELRAFRSSGLSPTMNLGRVRTFEGEVRISGCCRLPPTVTDAVYENWLRKLGSAVQEVGATFRVRDYRGGFTTPGQSAWIQSSQEVLREMGLDAALGELPVSTEANVFSRLGVECVVWGPGQSVGNSHAPNERIKISDLKMACEFYRRLIERHCT